VSYLLEAYHSLRLFLLRVCFVVLYCLLRHSISARSGSLFLSDHRLACANSTKPPYTLLPMSQNSCTILSIKVLVELVHVTFPFGRLWSPKNPILVFVNHSDHNHLGWMILRLIPLSSVYLARNVCYPKIRGLQ